MAEIAHDFAPLQYGHKNRAGQPNRIAVCLLLTGIIFYVGLRLWHLGTYPLWFDEVFSVNMAKLDWTKMFATVLADRIHPPFYYTVLKLWTAVFGFSVLSLRAASSVCSILTLIPLGRIAKRLSLTWTTFSMVIWISAFNPFLIHYSQEVRMYALVVLLSVWSIDLYTELLTNDSIRTFTWFSAVNVLLIMTHYSGVAIVSIEAAHFLYYRRSQWRRFLMACIPPVAALGLWMTAVLHYDRGGGLKENIDWIPRPQIADIPHLYGDLGGRANFPKASIFSLILFLPPILLSLRTRCKNRSFDETYILLVLLTTLPALALFLMSILLKPMWEDKYLIICAFPYLLLFGTSLADIPTRWRNTFACCILVWISIAGLQLARRDDARLRFDSLASDIIALEREGAVPVLAAEIWESDPVQFALSAKGSRVTVSVLQNTSATPRGRFLFLYRDPYSKAVPLHLIESGCIVQRLDDIHTESQSVVLAKLQCTDR